MFNFGVQETKEKIDVTVDTAKKTADEAQSIMREMKTTHVIEKAQNAAEAASSLAKEAQTIFTKIEKGHVVDNANKIAAHMKDITLKINEEDIITHTNETITAMKNAAVEATGVLSEMKEIWAHQNTMTIMARDAKSQSKFWTIIFISVCSALCFFPIFLCLLYVALDISAVYGFDHRFILFFSFWASGILSIAALTYWHLSNNMSNEKKFITCTICKRKCSYSLTCLTFSFIVFVWVLQCTMTYIINLNYPDANWIVTQYWFWVWIF